MRLRMFSTSSLSIESSFASMPRLACVKIVNFVIQIGEGSFTLLAAQLPSLTIFVSVESVRSVENLGQIVGPFFLSAGLRDHVLDVMPVVARRGEVLPTDTRSLFQQAFNEGKVADRNRAIVIQRL